METKANHFAIGVFVLVLLTIGFAFLYWMNAFGSGNQTKQYAVLFDGPVNGIDRGSVVLFNGIDVGRVRALNIDSVDTTRVRVTIDVHRLTPVRKDSMARITTQGLTGTAAIQITAGSRSVDIMPPSTRRRIAVITTAPGATQSLFDAAPQVLGNADSAIRQLNEILRINREPIRRTVANIESVSEVLAANKDHISGLITDVRGLARKIEKIEPLLDNTNALVKKLDRVVGSNEARIAKTLDNVETFTGELAANKDDISSIVKNVKTVTNDLRDTGKIISEAGVVISRINKLVDANEAHISSAVSNVQSFSAALNRNKGQVDEIFNDIRSLSAQLKSAAGKMENMIDKAGVFLESEDGLSIIDETRAAVTSFRKLVTQLEGSVGANADSLTRSTKRSLAELELFMRDGRRLARNLDRVLDGIDRNPQRLLFGGSSVPEYNPQ